MRRAFFRADLILAKMILIDALDSRFVVFIFGRIAIFVFTARIFDLIVSNSNSTFLFGPRSHRRDLLNLYMLKK